MKASWSFASATGVLLLAAAALYACSDDETTTPGTTNPEASTPDTGSQDDGGGGSDAPVDSPTQTCAYFQQPDANLPDISPQACNECAQANCCTQITKCFAASPADAGFDGSNGTKTQCELYGECEAACAPNDLVCAAQCATHYGVQAENDWGAWSNCVYGSGSPCESLCN